MLDILKSNLVPENIPFKSGGIRLAKKTELLRHSREGAHYRIKKSVRVFKTSLYL